MLSIFKRGAAVVLASFLTVSASFVPAFAGVFKEIRVVNECSSTVELFVRYVPLFESIWINKGWWTFSPGESAFLSSNKVRISHWYSNTLYLYAHTKYNNNSKWAGGHSVRYNGRVYNMMVPNWNKHSTYWQVNLTCD